jgi:hypothetical protein
LHAIWGLMRGVRVRFTVLVQKDRPTVGSLKRALAQRTGVPAHAQQLVVYGSPLSDGMLLADVLPPDVLQSRAAGAKSAGLKLKTTTACTALGGGADVGEGAAGGGYEAIDGGHTATGGGHEAIDGGHTATGGGHEATGAAVVIRMVSAPPSPASAESPVESPFVLVVLTGP